MDDYLKPSYLLGLRCQALERKLLNETDPESRDFDRLLEKLQKTRCEQLRACREETKKCCKEIDRLFYGNDK